MKIPVLIPARNEAAFIADTIASLPESTEPIVIPNGCSDETESIAIENGATIAADSQKERFLLFKLAFVI